MKKRTKKVELKKFTVAKLTNAYSIKGGSSSSNAGEKTKTGTSAHI